VSPDVTTLGFVAIVKDEAAVIARCLDSVSPLVDYVLIVDTGSKDNTRGIVAEWMARNCVPGQVIEREWRDFSHNRNEALAALREVAEVDYALTIDADEYLVFEPGFDPVAFKRALPAADAYQVMTWHGDHRYRRMQIFSNRLPFRYKDVLHSYLVAPDGARVAVADGFHDQYTYDGARAKNPRKFLDNAEILERELAKARDPADVARYTFYLAQSYRDAGLPEKARDAFIRRAGMGLWQEEVCLSWLYAGYAMERLGQLPELTLSVYLKAFEALPHRAEPLCAAARACRTMKTYQHGYLLAKAGLERTLPDGLFVDASVYEWRMLDEFQISAYWSGHIDDAVEASERLLSEAKFPEDQRERIEANAAYALAKFDAAAQ
jgi:glycosyltransferase involved in cell wall biosynthesis